MKYFIVEKYSIDIQPTVRLFFLGKNKENNLNHEVFLDDPKTKKNTVPNNRDGKEATAEKSLSDTSYI